MAISEKKRRYSVTLTPSIVNRFQALCKEFGMPPGTMSNACDDAILEISKVFQTAKDQGKFDIHDIFRLMGQQVELIMEEERKEKKPNASNKRKTTSANKKAA
jgi:phosphoribosylformylglycinamidine (FGAM) synthase-like enzyme